MNSEQNNELLFGIQMVIENLNDTINFIKTGATIEEIENCLYCDGDMLNRIRVCLRNGGYDND